MLVSGSIDIVPPADDFNVIVFGGGGAGLSACASASAAGASVLLIEAGTRTGGSTALSGGVFYAAGTSLQREAGVDDPGVEAMIEYYLALNQYKLEPALVRRLCEGATPAFEWLRDIGVEFGVDDLYAAGVDKLRRGHRATGGGAAIAERIEGSFSGRNVEVALDTRVDRLLVEDGRVVGIEVDGAPVRGRAVVIATGGFGANPAKLAELYPDAVRHGDLHWYIGADTCRGDGLDIGRAAGAVLSPSNCGLLLLTPGFAKDLESYLPGWLMLVNAHGRRFIDETIEYSVLAEVLSSQSRAEAYAIFDESRRVQAKAGRYRSAPNWTAERLAEFADDGRLVRAATLAALAAEIDVPADALEVTVARYNAGAAAGADADFFKQPDMLAPIADGPFYAARVRAAIICWTGTGLRIDRDARVLDAAGRPIPGLYAAGETTGGMFGQCYASGGASIANAVVFGRIAGSQAASHRFENGGN